MVTICTNNEVIAEYLRGWTELQHDTCSDSEIGDIWFNAVNDSIPATTATTMRARIQDWRGGICQHELPAFTDDPADEGGIVQEALDAGIKAVNEYLELLAGQSAE